MKGQKLGFEEGLKDVVSSGRCAGCGACVATCPVKALDYQDGPVLTGECKECGICSQVCPRREFNLTELEEMAFGRARTQDEEFGVYQKMVVAKATDPNITAVCQDGGVVTAILASTLEDGTIDGAVVSGLGEKPFYPVPIIAKSLEELLEAAGTRYTYSPNLLALRDIAKFESVAVVGTPCHIQSIRKMQKIPLKKYTRRINCLIGLFCTESFQYEGLMSALSEKLGISPRDIKKMSIKAKMIIYTKSGEEKSIPLKELRPYTRTGCHYCTDFSSELADISVGAVGLTGWNLVIIRSEKGEEIFNQVMEKGILETRPVEQEKRALELLSKLTKMKRKRGT